MKILLACLAIVGIAFSASGQTAQRLDRIETPPSRQILSNSTTLQVDFSSNAAPVFDYWVTDLSANVTLQLTNLAAGRTRRVWIDVDGSARTVAIATNGITTGFEVLYPYTSGVNTNGSSAFTVTNLSRVDILVHPNKKVGTAQFYHFIR